MSKDILIRIASDFVCPWCLVGHVRLERALEDSGLGANVKIEWLPFELNPDMPAEGKDRKEYLTAKFGGPEKLKEIEARMKAVGEADGIPFRQDLIKRSPNTFKAHRLAWYGSQKHPDKVDALVRKIFEAYFTEGKDIGDAETLATIAADAGLNKKDVLGFLNSDQGTKEVRKLEEEVRGRGITMVPYFTIGNEDIRGAVPAADIAKILKAA